MTRAEVERLLGGPGEEIPATELPGVVDWSVPVDSPRRIKAVVSGDTFVRWGQMFDTHVIVGFEDGVMKEKYYYEPSL